MDQVAFSRNRYIYNTQSYWPNAMSYIHSNPRAIDDGLFPYSGDIEHKLRFLLNYAILAPSHYNAQPWLFRLNQQSMDVFLDTARVSRISDPDARESIISCGAAIKMIELAACYFGLETRVIITATKNSTHLARIELDGQHEPTDKDISFFHAIKQRQTNRNWFKDAEVSESVTADCLLTAEALGVGLNFTQDKQQTAPFASLTAKAVHRQFSNPWYRFEFTSWQRSAISLKHDGLTGFGFFRHELPYPLAIPLLQRFGLSASISRYNHKKLVDGSPTLAILSTKDNSVTSWLNTGRMLSHVLLSLTANSLSASFMNQAIQEPDLRCQLPKIFDSLHKPQLVLRVGSASSVQWTPRRLVEQTLI